MVAVAPGFGEYQAKTSRVIPLFELSQRDLSAITGLHITFDTPPPRKARQLTATLASGRWPYSRSMMVALAMPPASHIVCSP